MLFICCCFCWFPAENDDLESTTSFAYVLAVSCAFPACFPFSWLSLCRWSVADEVDWLKRRLTAGHKYSLSWLQILLAHHGTIGQRQIVCRAARSLHGLEKTWERRGENTEIPLVRFSQSKMHWTEKASISFTMKHIWDVANYVIIIVVYLICMLRPSAHLQSDILNGTGINANRSVDESDGRKKDWDASLTTWLKLSASDTVSAKQVLFFRWQQKQKCGVVSAHYSHRVSDLFSWTWSQRNRSVHERLLASPCIISGLRIMKSDGPAIIVDMNLKKHTHIHLTFARAFC